MRNPLKPVLEIRSKAGELHFQRWAIWQSSWFNIYIHYIAKSDADKHPHEHPWNFVSIPFIGGYVHKTVRYGWDGHATIDKEKCRPLIPIYMNCKYLHRVRLLKPTWSIVVTGRRVNDDWCYRLDNGDIIGHEAYRKRKNEGTL